MVREAKAMANGKTGRLDKKALWIWEGYLLLAALLPAAGSVVLACLPIPVWISWAFTGLWGALWLFFAVFFLPVMHKRFSYRMTGDRLEDLYPSQGHARFQRQIPIHFRRSV